MSNLLFSQFQKILTRAKKKKRTITNSRTITNNISLSNKSHTTTLSMNKIPSHTKIYIPLLFLLL